MAQEGNEGDRYPDGKPPDDMNGVGNSRGTGLIFVLVALALILAIGFFYMTKDRDSYQGRELTETVESGDSAARVVGDAAQNAADRFDGH